MALLFSILLFKVLQSNKSNIRFLVDELTCTDLRMKAQQHRVPTVIYQLKEFHNEFMHATFSVETIKGIGAKCCVFLDR